MDDDDSLNWDNGWGPFPYKSEPESKFMSSGMDDDDNLNQDNGWKPSFDYPNERVDDQQTILL